MYLDAFTMSALVDEFMDTFVGGRVQDAIDTDVTGIGLEIYANRRRHYLYMSADNAAPRVHLAEGKLRRGLQQPKQLGLLMRRFVEGGTVLHVSQPPYERIMHIEIDGPEGEVEIIIEPMERRSNLYLVKDGVILDCMRRIGPADNRYRLALPNHDYVPPPPMKGRRDPLTVTRDDVAGFFEQTEDRKRKTYQVLTGHLLGMSPLLAKEIVFRTAGNVAQKAVDVDIDAITDRLKTIVEPLGARDWNPGSVSEDGLVQAYSVYPLQQMDDWQPVHTISGAMAAYYGAPVGEEAYEAAKKPARAAIVEGRAKMGAKLASLERSLKDDAEMEHLRQSGELILAYQYTLEENQTELKAQYDPSGPELSIRIDPSITPLENAQRFFNRYNKAKRALEDVPGLIDEVRTELAYLDQLENDLALARNWPDIDEVQQALIASGYWQGKQAKRIGGGGQSAPIRVVSGDGFVIWIGRNSRQNEIVTFKKSGKDDLWLHARDVPGAHVIIKNDGRRIPEEVIEHAASLAAYYSSLRSEGRVPVDVTRIKYVKKIRGAAQGMVTYRNEETRTAIPKNEKALEVE